MSTIEKIIGIAAICVICAVFMIAIRIGLAYLTRWIEKGVNPNNSFPRNRKNGGLSREQQRALNVGAILAGSNSDYCDSLQACKAVARKTIKTVMGQDWGIYSEKDALERLENLKNTGHRQMYNLVLKNASRLLASGENIPVNPRSIFQLTGFSLLDQNMLTKFEKEAAIAGKNIELMDELLKPSSFENFNKYQDIFGDERTFSICIKIFHQFYEQCLAYAGRITNLKEALPDLRKEGFLGNDPSGLERIDVTAWDMGRMVNVARYCFDLGYISESQAWEYIFFAERESSSHYTDWADFGRAYIIGRAMWGGKNMNLYGAMSTLKKLKTSKKSPWALAPLR